MSAISMREMLEAGIHFGHQTRYWNPQMAAYLYGHRNKIHIIDLEQTKVMFQEALNYLGKLSAGKGTVLFVGTKRAARQIIREEAERCGMPYVNLRWLGGLLTNYKTVKQSINRLRELEEMKTNGAMERMSKKEALHFQRELDKLERNMSGIKDMDGWPDALFIIDVGYEDIAVSEAVKLGIPVVGVVDSNNSPAGVDYVIPGNDDAIRSIRLYTKAVADAILDGRDSIAHLGEMGGDQEEFIELDAEGAPVVKDKRKKQSREKVQIKQKPARKSVKKVEPAKTGSDEEQQEAAQAEPKADAVAVTAPQAEKAVSDTNRNNAICERVRQVPKGKVATYSRIARLTGKRCTPQQVGTAIRDLSDDTEVPWQRIIGSKGEIKPRSGPRGDAEQRRLLEEEGIVFSPDGTVDLSGYQWNGPEEKTEPAAKQDTSAAGAKNETGQDGA